MSATVRHRGPDDSGCWLDEDAGLGLGHRRLSIIDLSAAGHQPMASTCGRYVIAFNGEIYNHLALRAELEATKAAPAWRGHSDTETLLACFAVHGVAETLRRSVGMFAIAVWDRSERRLDLARDRLGEKPLYYGWVRGEGGSTFVFGSELKALRAWPGFDNAVDRDALSLYFQFGAVPAPYAIHHDVFKLAPGTLLSLDIDGLWVRALRIAPYWRLTDAIRRGRNDMILDEARAISALDEALRESLRLQAVADVPLGVFLSGGVDSSVIAALMQAEAKGPVRTFTACFDEAQFNEGDYARAVARHIGTEHHELRVTAADALAIVSHLTQLCDEPFADSSLVPTYLICREARRHVTVALSGDAGDELFGGYNRHFWLRRVWRMIARFPLPARQILASAILAAGAPALDMLGRVFAGGNPVLRFGEKAQKVADRFLSARDADDLYLGILSEWPAGKNLVCGAHALPRAPGYEEIAALLPEIEDRMMAWDSLSYLPNDILAKVDHAAMGVSLETRAPLLDHRVVELAWRLPSGMKIRDGRGKWALRQVLYKYVPRELVERPKAGFALPLAQWLRGPLRDWAEALLDKSRIAREGYLDPGLVEETWRQHLNGRNMSERIWSVLVFQLWLEAKA
jgi:asparagine synthase (glutamine-hydrolysing)